MLTYWEILTAIQSNVSVNDSYAQLWGRKAQGGYTVATYTGTLPATLTGTKAGYLHRYKIYGNTEQDSGTTTYPIMSVTVQALESGTNYAMFNLADFPDVVVGDKITPQECGERTENLWDENYTNISTILTYNPVYVGDGLFTASTDCPLSYPGGRASLFFIAGNVSTGASAANALYDKVKRTVESISGYVTIAYRSDEAVNPNNYNLMLNAGSTALPYEPYGYKLPLTSAGQSVDIYLGDDTISAEEYVDSGTGKIYRVVGGTLAPVDPPVPFPQIPTAAGSTTISWAGEGLAPSQVELEYEKKR